MYIVKYNMEKLWFEEQLCRLFGRSIKDPRGCPYKKNSIL